MESPSSEPGDRALLPVTWTGSKPNPIAAAHVRLVGNSLVFDLSNSMPEKDIALEKQDFGDLYVVLVNGQSVVAPLGRIGYDQYNKAAYERNAGIVTLSIDPYWAMMAAFLRHPDPLVRQYRGALRDGDEGHPNGSEPLYQ